VIITRDQQYAAVSRATREIQMLEDIAAAIDARPFSVPKRKHAGVVGFTDQMELLRPPYGGSRHLLVDSGLKLDVVDVKMPLRFPERLVKSTERRTSISGYESRGIQTCSEITPTLDQQEADDRLDTGQVDPAVIGRVLLVQTDFAHV
jgi:hypothetical protein